MTTKPPANFELFDEGWDAYSDGIELDLVWPELKQEGWKAHQADKFTGGDDDDDPPTAIVHGIVQRGTGGDQG